MVEGEGKGGRERGEKERTMQHKANSGPPRPSEGRGGLQNSAPPLGPLIERDKEKGEGGYWRAGKVLKRVPEGHRVVVRRRKRLLQSRYCGTGTSPWFIRFLKK